MADQDQIDNIAEPEVEEDAPELNPQFKARLISTTTQVVDGRTIIMRRYERYINGKVRFQNVKYFKTDKPRKPTPKRISPEMRENRHTAKLLINKMTTAQLPAVIQILQTMAAANQ